MTDKIVEYSTAKLAKEKGFNIAQETFYNEGSGWNLQSDSLLRTGSDTFVEAPTQSLLQKWLREQHRIKVLIDYFCIGSDDYEWGYVLKYEVGNAKRQCERLKIVESVEFYPGGYTNSVWPDNSYEAALEKGLLEALKLI